MSCKPKKILIVEDDADFTAILKMKFSAEGFAVFTASDGESAVSVAEQEKPDLILSDVLLPKMNGLEMAEKIKSANREVAIVFLTNLKETDLTEKIQKTKEFGYWIKSDLRPSDIVEKVKAKLGIK